MGWGIGLTTQSRYRNLTLRNLMLCQVDRSNLDDKANKGNYKHVMDFHSTIYYTDSLISKLLLIVSEGTQIYSIMGLKTKLPNGDQHGSTAEAVEA
jgi:hypothetical protein